MLGVVEEFISPNPWVASLGERHAWGFLPVEANIYDNERMVKSGMCRSLRLGFEHRDEIEFFHVYEAEVRDAQFGDNDQGQ
jgi:hypothetical protein